MYNESLINLANTYIKQNGRISKDEMLLLIYQIENKSVEKDTLKYIVQYYNCTVCAINLYNNYIKIK
jgi:translation initiation factor 2 beta subunit (eIF-2beta)/eIF-5